MTLFHTSLYIKLITIISNEYSGVKTKIIKYFSDKELKEVKKLILTPTGEFSENVLVEQKKQEVILHYNIIKINFCKNMWILSQY